MCRSFFANLRLGGITDGEKAVVQLLGGNDAEHVRLVLILILGAAHITVIIKRGVVAGRNGIKAQGHTLLQQCAEFNLLIAAQARIRGFTAGIGIHEVRDDLFLEFLRKVPDVKRNAQLIANAAGIGGILQRTAAAGFFARLLRVLMQRQVHADDIVASLHRTGGGDR